MAREPRPRRLKVVRYVDADGRQVRKGSPGARRVETETETYYGWVGGERVPLGTTDEGLAWQELRRLLRQAREKELGIARPGDERLAMPIADHVEAWLKTVADGGAGDPHVKTLRARVTELAGLAKWRRLPDVSADSATDALARVQASKKRGMAAGHTGRSARTRNHYLRAVKQFTRWACPKLLPADPLRELRTVPVEGDRRHDRRSPTDAEVLALFSHLEGTALPEGGPPRRCPSRCGMSGAQRALGYKVAMATGLRAGELRSLSRESFDLDGDAPAVTVAAAYDKRRRLLVQPLPAWLATELRAWFAAGGACWPGFPAKRPGRLLVADLKLAGVPYSVPDRDGSPLFFDMHALRHYYCTALANQPGISPKTLMELCRHSTPTLTLKTYAHAKTEALRAAVDGLRRPGGEPKTSTTPPPTGPALPAP